MQGRADLPGGLPWLSITRVAAFGALGKVAWQVQVPLAPRVSLSFLGTVVVVPSIRKLARDQHGLHSTGHAMRGQGCRQGAAFHVQPPGLQATGREALGTTACG